MKAIDVAAINAAAVPYEVAEVGTDVLKAKGAMVATSGFTAANEVITFPPFEQLKVLARKIRGTENNAYEVKVDRDGKPGRFGISNLRRRTVNPQSGLSELSTGAKKFHNTVGLDAEAYDYERLQAVAGKSIKCVGFETALRRDINTQQNVPSQFALFEVEA